MYRSVEKGAAVITGAEQVKNWELVEGTMMVCADSERYFWQLQSIYDSGKR